MIPGAQACVCPSGSLIWHHWEEGELLLRSRSPALCLRPWKGWHVPLCVWLSVLRVCVGGRREHGVSYFTSQCQAPSAAPFFALNGLSKDPLSRAAESFLHFKKKKRKKGRNFFWVSVETCEEMLNSSSLWQELTSGRCGFALCSPSRTVTAQLCPPRPHPRPHPFPSPFCIPVSGSSETRGRARSPGP